MADFLERLRHDKEVLSWRPHSELLRHGNCYRARLQASGPCGYSRPGADVGGRPRDVFQRQDTVTMLATQILRVRRFIPELVTVWVREHNLEGGRPPVTGGPG